MSLNTPERLYKLLPAVLRLRDTAQGEPLRALLAVIEDELERVEADTATLYDNWFIETCEEWVVPYIGELLGVRPVRPIESAGVSARAYVANTLAYRRRKGTAVVLEELARDTSGWPARAVEFFSRLATTQHMNHVRLSPAATASVRQAAQAELVDSAFDPCAHTLDIGNIASRGSRYNIPNVGLFLWRLRSYRVGAGSPGDEAADFASARQLADGWRIHPCGCDAPLFNSPRTETTLTHLAEEDNLPGSLRRLALNEELQRLRLGLATPAPHFMTERDPVLRVFVRLAGEAAPVEVARKDMYVCSLSDAVATASPVPRALAFDPVRGRMAFPAGLDVQEVWVHGNHGFSGDLGGGPYPRDAAVRSVNAALSIDPLSSGGEGGFYDRNVWQAGVTHLLDTTVGQGRLFASLREAIDAWHLQPAGRTGVIVLMDSLSEHDTALEVQLGERSKLLIVAGQWPLEPIPGETPGSVERVPGHFEASQIRAHRIGNLVVRGTAAPGSDNAGALFINGLLLEGSLSVVAGELGQLALSHCSLIPGSGALQVLAGGNEQLELVLERSICAALAVAGPIRGITLRDSILGDGAAAGSPDTGLQAAQSAADLQRCSVFGSVTVQSLSASDCIFAGPVQALRRQTGCVRFSYVAPGSAVPRRYRCQPELEASARVASLRQAAQAQGRVPTAAEEDAQRAEAAATIRPLFVSRRYGDPGFGQLAQRCAAQLRSGAESGAEMGAFEFLQQPQREANLRDALAESLRFGLEAGLVFVT